MTDRSTSPVKGRDRLARAERLPLELDSLVGSFFHSDHGRQWQGCIVAEAAPGVYLAELFDWIVGSSTAQELVRIEDMAGWRFYDSAEWMNNAYSNGLGERWRRARVDDDGRDAASKEQNR